MKKRSVVNGMGAHFNFRSIFKQALIPTLVFFALSARSQCPTGGGPTNDAFGVKMMFPTNNAGAKPWLMGLDDYKNRLEKSGSISGSGTSTVMSLSGKTRCGVKAIESACEGLTDHKKAAAQQYMCSARDWKNFEMTCYFNTTDLGGDDFTMYGRGGRHTGDGYPDGCLGSAYKASVDISGKVRWGKEQWHVSYDYSKGGGWKSSGIAVKGKWIGYKIVVYNTGSVSNPDVVLELWIDGGDNSVKPSNQWKLVSKVIDAGGWGSQGSECGGAKDQKIIWGGPHVTFRTDQGSVKIKWASIREIDPGGTFNGSGMILATSTTTDNGTSSGTASVSVTGGAAPYTYAWNNGQTSAVISNLQASTYTVTVKDANGCTETKTAVVSLSSTPPPSGGCVTVTSSVIPVKCNGENNGAINLNVSGGTTPYTFFWSGGACSKLSVSGTSASGNDGNVPANAFDGNMSTRWSQNLSGAWIRADLGSVKSVCSVDIAWYKGNERSNNFAIALSSDGTTYKDVFSGKSSGTTANPEHYQFSAAAARYVRITVTGNSTSNWASITEIIVNGGNGTYTQNLAGAEAGTYTVTVTDAKGCSVTHSAVVTQPAAITVVAAVSPDQGSGNGSATLSVSGGTPAYSYAWSNGANTAIVSGLKAGAYVVTVTDAAACTVVKTVTVAGCAKLKVTSVTANGNDGNVPANAFDGNLSTRWSYNLSGAWIRADLGVKKNICGVQIAWYKGNERSASFIIAVSDDGQKYTDIFSGKSSGTTTALESYTTAAGAGRFVRITVKGNSVNTWASISEVVIEGTGGNPNPADTSLVRMPGDAAIGRSNTVSSKFGDEDGPEEISGTSTMEVYPNPATSNVVLALTSSADAAYRLTLFNAIGQAVYEGGIAVSQGRNEIMLPMSHLQKGIYFVVVSNDQQILRERIIRE